MSTAILEPLPGLASKYKRQHNWEGALVQTSASQIEARMQQQSYPRFSWDLIFNYLQLSVRGTYTDTIASQNLQYLDGFYSNQAGALLSFFYRDQEYNSVTTGFIGTGDGTTKVFQLQADIGGAFFPVYGVDTRGAITYGGAYTQPAALTPQAYDNGSPVSGTFASETGILTLASAPASGHTVTATFSYLFRCRFVENNLDFQRMWNVVYELESLKIIQVLA